ncbi:MAG: hypothetical protein JF614_14600 [Acidobacteria bacterium]|nr:hypothetical protein [Acidobacteriota bacterium]
MAEIRVERRQSNTVPWIVGLIVLALVILWSLKAVSAHSHKAGLHRGTSAVNTFQDPTPPPLRQFAQATVAPGLRAA